MNLPANSHSCCHEHQPRTCADRPPLLTVEGLAFERDGRTILTDVNLSVDRGDFLAITGPNGGGKTTFLRLILGLLKPSSGSIRYFADDGKEISRLVRPGYLPQKSSVDPQFPVSVGEVVASGLLANKALTADERAERISRALSLADLTDLTSRPIGRLSGGQLQRALFARAIVDRPDVLILDEPLSYIDQAFGEHLYAILDSLRGQTTVLLVSHQMSRIASMATRHIIVDHTLRQCHNTSHYVEQKC